jgi:hypothetical protein
MAAWIAVAAAVLLAGCAAPATRTQVTELRRSVENPRIVLMPIDVELSELSAGGVLEPKAEWTRAASDLLVAGLRAEKQRLGFNLVDLTSSFKGNEREAELVEQLNKLHGVVGKSIMLHRVVRLPNKGEGFDWSLGPEVKVLRERTGADYALFVFVRDSYASDGRKAAIVAAAILGVGLTAGQQLGFASLVDLQTGDVVWFNQVARGSGDLRTAEPANETVKVLLTGFPK